ncbi:MAG: DUF4936 family protein [Betaproteobacteria bacterium]|nr:DUF4936 family protein [Betaproteobacteria bacterium]MSQ89002.1 DUF4936 family protein [Betaproteobacteria bacterium]
MLPGAGNRGPCTVSGHSEATHGPLAWCCLATRTSALQRRCAWPCERHGSQRRRRRSVGRAADRGDRGASADPRAAAGGSARSLAAALRAVTNYYVYYRLDPARLDFFRSAINILFKTIQNASGVQGRWLRRRDDPATYMEVYEGVADEQTFDALLEGAAAQLGLERKIERFVCL